MRHLLCLIVLLHTLTRVLPDDAKQRKSSAKFKGKMKGSLSIYLYG